MKRSNAFFLFFLISFISCTQEIKKGKGNHSVTKNSPTLLKQSKKNKGVTASTPKNNQFFEKGNNCLGCHKNIEMIVPEKSEMFQAILNISQNSGINNYCTVCHGGNPDVKIPHNLTKGSEEYEKIKKLAHNGTPSYFESHEGPKMFYPDPGSPWINQNTCGVCHKEQVNSQWKSLMMTEAGKIQGALWGFGGITGYKHKYANYDVTTSQSDKIIGTEAYKKYVKNLMKKEPQAFPKNLKSLPEAPVGGHDVSKNPKIAAYTYIRGECQRCHLGVKGVQRYGDYRGLGCSACHVPYSNSGFYEGKDPAMPKDETGHPLVHTIQATSDKPVTVNGITYSGIPVETCTTCHNRGRRIGVSFQGLMESAYHSPWTKTGGNQKKLHGKHYIKLKSDLHAQKGFLCQDCHTTGDVHSSNFISGTVSGAVEIECTDCHGTVDKYPWELPLGWGDEYSEKPANGEARGVSNKLPSYLEKGKVYPKEDGYLLTARGNPFGNVVKSENLVKVYLASGKVKTLKPLKYMKEYNMLNLKARVAMVNVKTHLKKMECYACHATWAPQCYGCHVKVDYSSVKKEHDWINIGKNHNKDGTTNENNPQMANFDIKGKISETRSYLRWEDPPLAINGEGRVSPVIPGCQTTVTVINDKKEPVLLNHIFPLKGVETAGKNESVLALDMAPLHPHTVQKHARSCTSCHSSEKALGYGISGGKVYEDYSKAHVIDIQTADGKLLSKHKVSLMEKVDNLSFDWSRFVTENGKQIQTVGHHFTLSRPLNNKERFHMTRNGVCLACHKEIPEKSLAVSILHHIAEVSNLLPETDEEHSSLLTKTLMIAGWFQVTMIFFIPILIMGVLFLIYRKKKKKN